MKGILIDPKTHTITETDQYDGNYKTIQKIIGCDCFTIVHLDNDDNETLYIDDEGLINGNGARNGFFYVLGDNPIALAGKGLILGTDREGDSIATQMTIDQVKAIVRFGYITRGTGDKVSFLDTDGQLHPVY